MCVCVCVWGKQLKFVARPLPKCSTSPDLCCYCCKFMSRTARYIRHAAILCSVCSTRSCHIARRVWEGVQHWGGNNISAYCYERASDQPTKRPIMLHTHSDMGRKGERQIEKRARGRGERQQCGQQVGKGAGLQGRFSEDLKRVAIISKRRPI